MADLWQTLGYDKIASDIATALLGSDDIVVVQGPPGVGKSWLARGIGGLWQEGGGSTVVAEGDTLKSDIPLYPFGFAMAALSRGWRSVGPAVSGIARAGEALLGTAGIVTATVETLAKAHKARRRRDRSVFLGDNEQTVLSELERLGNKQPMLLIADNLHWWDADSLGFLRSLREPRMRAAFPFLGEMRIVAVQTIAPYQEVAHPEAHERFLSPGVVRRFDLGRVPRNGFASVLAALGADPQPSAEVADLVHTLSGGHLALASRTANRIAEGQASSFLSAADSQEFIRRLLTERIGSLGPMGREAVRVLQIAAVLGLSFRRNEVACASDGDESDVSRLLRYCRDEDLLDLSDGIGRFVHDLYRQHFLNIDASERVGIHERLSDCLRILRPAEYELRALNAVEAERPGETATLAIQAAIQRQREGRSWRDLAPPILSALEEASWDALADDFARVIGHLKNYRFGRCIATLDGMPRDLPKSLAAEADYLRAMCLMSTRSEEDRAVGRAILEAWMGYEEVEPELGIRLMQLFLYGLTHLGDKGPGRSLEGRIRQVLIDRVGFDTAARDALYTLDRCAGSLYPSDIAVVRNREAVAHYRPDEGHTVHRRPVEYYRCLVNYGASLICNARYDDARDVYRTVDRLVSGYAEGVFPRLEYPYMNELLAEHRLGLVAAEHAVDRQRQILDEVAVDSDPFYGGNALAVYLALSSRFAEALDLFDRIDHELRRSRREPEPSMVYLIGANRCATRFVAGDVEVAQREWSELGEIATRIAYASRSILLRRHELLAERVNEGIPMAPRAFDECLVLQGHAEFGPLWENYGRGFRMPAVEFWREN